MKVERLLIVLSLVALLMACSSGGGQQAYQPQQPTVPSTPPPPPPPPPPAWVTNLAAAYPTSEWLVETDQGDDISTTEASATARLLQRIRVDINVMRETNEHISETVNNFTGQETWSSTAKTDFTQNLVSSSSIQGLVGLEVENYTDHRTGTVHAIARMNRRDGAARYDALIKENESIIDELFSQADSMGRSFDAVKLLNLAQQYAILTENYLTILSVLDPNTAGRRPAFGNTEAVRTRTRDTQQRIVIHVTVDGDVHDRIRRAFTDALQARGFRTAALAASQYVLDVTFVTEDRSFANSGGLIHRAFVLNYALRDKASNIEILSDSVNERHGHSTRDAVNNLLLRSAEKNIAEDGFAAKFDEFLQSL